MGRSRSLATELELGVGLDEWVAIWPGVETIRRRQAESPAPRERVQFWSEAAGEGEGIFCGWGGVPCLDGNPFAGGRT